MADELQRLTDALPEYELGPQVGQGGWARVHSARHRVLGRTVAVKELPPAVAADPELRRRFEAEARVLASFDHPHIVPVHQLVEHEGTLLLVMDLLDGGSLWERILRGGSSLADACAIGMAMANALDYAHRRGVLHRDVKPQNILFTPGGVPKLIDFGLAKIIGASTMATVRGQILGTPAYLAPEQVSGAPISPATDVYALAAVLFELLSGELPFPDLDDPIETMLARLSREPRPLDEVVELPTQLSACIMRALRPEPEERYESAGVFADAIGRAAANAMGNDFLQRAVVRVFVDNQPQRDGRDELADPARRLPATKNPNRFLIADNFGDALSDVLSLLEQSDVKTPERAPQGRAGGKSASGTGPLWTVVVTDPNGVQVSRDLRTPVVLGREGDIKVDDPELSRRHLRLAPSIDGLMVEDLGSTNGTKLDGQAISGPTLLESESTISAGLCTVVLRPLAVPRETSADHTPGRPASTPPNRKTEELDLRGALCEAAGDLRIYHWGLTEDRLNGVVEVCERSEEVLRSLGADTSNTSVVILNPEMAARMDRLELRLSVGQVAASGNSDLVDEVPRLLASMWSDRVARDRNEALVLLGVYLHVLRPDAANTDPDAAMAYLSLTELKESLRTAAAVSLARFLASIRPADEISGFARLMLESGLEEASLTSFGLPWSALEGQWRDEISLRPRRRSRGKFLQLSLRFIRPHWKRQLEIVALALLGSVFMIASTYVTRRLFDDVLPVGLAGESKWTRFSDALQLLEILGAAFVVSTLSTARRSYAAARLSNAVTADLQCRMFDRLQSLPLSWHGRHDKGDIMSRFASDVWMVEAGLVSAIRDGASEVVTLIITAYLLIQLHPTLAFVTLLGAPVVSLAYVLMSRRTLRRSLEVEKRQGALTGVLAENLDAQPVVKAFGLEQREMDRFRLESDGLVMAQTRLWGQAGLFGVVISTVIQVVRVAVMLLGSWGVINGTLRLGNLAAFLALMGEVTAPMTFLAELGGRIQIASGAIVRLDEILESEESHSSLGASRLAAGPPAVEFVNVRFAYDLGEPIFEGLSFSVEPGQRVALVGGSGGGKSTVLSLLQRVHDVSGGEVRVGGLDVRVLDLPDYRRRMGVVFQDSFLFDASLAENIRLGDIGATDSQVKEAALRAGLADLLQLGGVGARVGARGSMLSGGQRQRVAIARALVRRPQLLLLDEATSALDPQTERLIAQTIRDVSDGVTTLAVTHRLHTTVDFDKILVLDCGRLVEEGNHAQLLARDGIYAAMWNEQMREAAVPLVQQERKQWTSALATPRRASSSRERASLIMSGLSPSLLVRMAADPIVSSRL